MSLGSVLVHGQVMLLQSISIFGISQREAGMLPVNWSFLLRLKIWSWDKRPISAGIRPVNSFSNNLNNESWFKIPSWIGREPDSLLLRSFIAVSLLMRPSSDGREPVRSLKRKLKSVSWVKRPSSEGREPPIVIFSALVPATTNDVSWVERPISIGIPKLETSQSISRQH